MCFCAGCPSIHFGFCGFAQCIFSYFIQFQFCPSQFIRTSQGLLADGYLGHIVLHDNLTVDIFAVYGNLTALFYGEGDFFRIAIAIRCIGFLQNVSFPCGQLFLYGMRLIGGDPFLYNLAILVQNLEGCTRNFFAASYRLLADGYLGHIVLHDNLTVDILAVDGNLAGLVNGKGDVFCIRITIWCVFFVQGIGCISVQNTLQNISVLGGDPLCNLFAVFVQNREGCPFYFCRSGDILLADGNFCCRILHDNSCNFALFIHSKFNIFGICIAIRCIFFVEGVSLASNQLFVDFVRLVGGSPFFDDLTGFILDLKLCSRNFLVASNVLLADGYLGGIIFHHDNAASIYIFAVFVLYCNLAVLVNGKGHGFCQYIAVRSGFFCQSVSASIELNQFRCLL